MSAADQLLRHLVAGIALGDALLGSRLQGGARSSSSLDGLIFVEQTRVVDLLDEKWLRRLLHSQLAGVRLPGRSVRVRCLIAQHARRGRSSWRGEYEGLIAGLLQICGSLLLILACLREVGHLHVVAGTDDRVVDLVLQYMVVVVDHLLLFVAVGRAESKRSFGLAVLAIRLSLFNL